MNPELFLSVRDLSVDYTRGSHQRAALTDIYLDLAVGQRLAVIGESGSGKSTLAHAIAGILPRTVSVAGNIMFPKLGHSLRLGKEVGIVFQDPSGSLNPVLTVGEQIAEVAVVHLGLTWAKANARALDLLDRVQIPRVKERARSYPHEFSGGQRQRIAIAAALVADPQFLIADEPTSALDNVTQKELVNLLDSLVRDSALTLLFVTHDIALASELADDVAVLYGGRLVEQGAIGRVFAAPASSYTSALLATRLDLHTPLRRRLPEIDPSDFSVRVPAARNG